MRHHTHTERFDGVAVDVAHVEVVQVTALDKDRCIDELLKEDTAAFGKASFERGRPPRARREADVADCNIPPFLHAKRELGIRESAVARRDEGDGAPGEVTEFVVRLRRPRREHTW